MSSKGLPRQNSFVDSGVVVVDAIVDDDDDDGDGDGDKENLFN